MENITPLSIRHILVPLDGSRLAESALNPAIVLAGRLGARVTLGQRSFARSVLSKKQRP